MSKLAWAASLVTVILVISPAQVGWAAADDPCAALAQAVRDLAEDGELEAADQLVEGPLPGCDTSALQSEIDEQRVAAVAAFLVADLRYQRVRNEGRLDEEKVDLVERFEAVRKLDRDLEAAAARIDDVQAATTPTTTTTTTIPLEEQVRRLDDLGLDEKARDVAAAAVPTGSTIPSTLIEDIDETPSRGERAASAWSAAIPVLVLLGAILIALALTSLVSRLMPPQLAINDGAGDQGPSFASLLRAKIVELAEGSGDAQLGTVQHTLPEAPQFGELNDHLKPVDWVLSNFAFKHWRNLHSTLHAPDNTGASITLDVRKGSSKNNRSLGVATIRTVPTPIAGLTDKSSVPHLIGPAAAWTIAHWKDPKHPSLPASTGTTDWRSFGATLAGDDHLRTGAIDPAIDSFSAALAHDENNLEARFLRLVAMQRKYATNTGVQDLIAAELDQLAVAVQSRRITA